MPKPVARLRSPAQLVASLPLWLGFLPTESLVAICCHEPRGRVGLTMRFDLPAPEHEPLLVRDVVRRVRQQRASRVVLAVYTAEPDGERRARAHLVEELRAAVTGVVTEAVLVRAGRFWSYLCSEPACCPAAGTPVDDARDSAPVRLLEAEQVLNGRAVLPDRTALAATVAGPVLLAAEVAAQRCEVAARLLTQAIRETGLTAAGDASLRAWREAVARFRAPPARLGEMEAAALAVSLVDVRVRDRLIAARRADVPGLLALLEELARRTPAPYDAAVCTVLAWLAYCEGGGPLVTIALDRALATDPGYRLAQLLQQAVLAQLPPAQLRLAG
ncbi:MAG: uncharacterized protein JWN87_3116 [Frankiales bacterium]|nr:uncharacterized protein [Frankiales bacterium]